MNLYLYYQIILSNVLEMSSKHYQKASYKFQGKVANFEVMLASKARLGLSKFKTTDLTTRWPNPPYKFYLLLGKRRKGKHGVKPKI